MVGRVRRGGVSGGIGLDPLDAVLHEFSNGAPGLIGTVDQEDQTFHPELQVVGVPVHQPAGAADFAAVGGEPRAGNQVVLDRLLQPDVNVVQAAAAPGRRVSALESQLGIAGREDRHIFDRILDVEVRQLGHIEVGRMKVRLHQARHDRSAPRVDPAGLRGNLGRAFGRSCVDDLSVLHGNGRVRHGWRPGSVHQSPVRDQEVSLCGLHGASLINNIDAACRVPIRCTYLQDRPNREPRAIGDRRNSRLRNGSRAESRPWLSFPE